MPVCIVYICAVMGDCEVCVGYKILLHCLDFYQLVLYVSNICIHSCLLSVLIGCKCSHLNCTTHPLQPWDLSLYNSRGTTVIQAVLSS